MTFMVDKAKLLEYAEKLGVPENDSVLQSPRTMEIMLGEINTYLKGTATTPYEVMERTLHSPHNDAEKLFLASVYTMAYMERNQ